MSSYFDEFDRNVRNLSTLPDDEFLARLIELEQQMKRTCLEFAGDRDTPEDVRQRITSCILTHEVRIGHEADGGPGCKSRGAETSLAMRRSQLSSEMHRLWHEIASMRLEPRYGLVRDNPKDAVRRRDVYAESRHGRGVVAVGH